MTCDQRLKQEELRLRKEELALRQWEAKYKSKADVTENGIKGLVLINGGSAAGLATLFQALISKEEAQSMIPFVLFGILFTVLGVATGSIVFWLRYQQGQLETQQKLFLQDNYWWRWVWRTCFISLSCFVVGLGVVVYGGLFHLKLCH